MLRYYVTVNVTLNLTETNTVVAARSWKILLAASDRAGRGWALRAGDLVFNGVLFVRLLIAKKQHERTVVVERARPMVVLV